MCPPAGTKLFQQLGTGRYSHLVRLCVLCDLRSSPLACSRPHQSRSYWITWVCVSQQPLRVSQFASSGSCYLVGSCSIYIKPGRKCPCRHLDYGHSLTLLSSMTSSHLSPFWLWVLAHSYSCMLRIPLSLLYLIIAIWFLMSWKCMDIFTTTPSPSVGEAFTWN